MTAEAPPPYLAGLRLAGRRVVVVGAGRVLARRLGTLLDSGARLVVVSPLAAPPVRAVARAARLTWHERDYRLGDLAGAWYALACTDDPQVNAAVVAEAEAARIFCVRADDGSLGTAVTPASARDGQVQLAVLAGGDFRASRHLRDRLAAQLTAAGQLAPATFRPGAPRPPRSASEG